MKSFIIVFMLSVGAFSVASATTYEWVDKAGVVHFTDAPDNIPADYRDKAVQRDSIDENRLSIVPTGPGPEKVAPSGQDQGTVLYGNQDVAWWRNRYATLDKEMTQLREGLPAKQDELAKLHKRWVVTMYADHRAAYYDKKAQIERDEARIAQLEQEIQKLKDEANRFGVPVPWRR